MCTVSMGSVPCSVPSPFFGELGRRRKATGLCSVCRKGAQREWLNKLLGVMLCRGFQASGLARFIARSELVEASLCVYSVPVADEGDPRKDVELLEQG